MIVRREVVAAGERVALAEVLDGDREWLEQRGDGAYDVDPDDRERLHNAEVYRLAVVDLSAGELVGEVSWHAVGYGRTRPCGAWNVGIVLLPAARGRGVGVQALRLLVEHLFATTDLDRIEASADLANVRSQRALGKSGFRAEGVVRGAQLRGGVRRDMMLFGLLRTDLVPPPAPGADREIVIARDGVALAPPVIGEREKFYVDAAGPFEVDRDDRPMITGPARSSVLSVLDAASGRLLGGVSWHAVDYGGTVGCSAWNIGIGLLPEERGRGVGSIAQRLLAEYLFATTELDRVEASTDVDNVGEQKALARAGFTREGILRGAQLREGVRRDLVHYGKLRTDE
ncbi:GNAT family N-acetyltransferase [Actinophytocola gossypii]|uniref:GNAT family N-acetyltransferase n=1 Tax=Actinophytocola gossypii TaxID=2812003 RepID=A0ABT2JJT4_9PSEU|nr:GNAT family protein [Actinophytocola gossypii]MCT2588147.1 GNAT family N-acetyltransferase [Actinophytocola gossypii]